MLRNNSIFGKENSIGMYFRTNEKKRNVKYKFVAYYFTRTCYALERLTGSFGNDLE